MRHFMHLFSFNLWKSLSDEILKIKAQQAWGSEAFCVSVVLSHLAQLRYMTAAPSPCGQWLRPLEQALEEIQWCGFMSVSHLDFLVRWGTENALISRLDTALSLVFWARNSRKISSYVVFKDRVCFAPNLMSTLCLSVAILRGEFWKQLHNTKFGR